MVEENKPVEEKPQEPAPVEPVDMIAKAEAAASRLEKANERMDANILRQEQLAVERTLGGVANVAEPELSKDAKAKLEAKKMLEGTGFEDMFD